MKRLLNIFLILSVFQWTHHAVAATACSDEIADTVATLRKSFGLSVIDIRLPEEDVCAQMNDLASQVSLRDALTSAVTSFLTDATDIGSALELALELAFEEHHLPYTEPVPENVSVRAKEILLDRMNRADSYLELARQDEVLDSTFAVKDNWIVRMRLPVFSDDFYWAVVDRAGKKPTLNY